MAKNKKVVKYRKPLQINIGVIFFVVIFFYMMYFVFQYFTTEHVAVFEVEQGKIAQNKNYTGLIIRDETVYSAEESGYVNYFTQDGSRAGSQSYIYSIDESGQFYNTVLESMDGDIELEQDYLDKLENTAYNFIMNYSDSAYYQVYNLNFDLQAELMEGVTQSALSDESLRTGNYSGLHIHKSPNAGVVVYYTDGFEDVTVENFTGTMFEQASYKKNNLLDNGKVNAGEPVYKMINSENWNVIIPISDSVAAELAEKTEIKVQFKKDDTSCWSTYTITQKEDEFYLILNFEHSSIRFSSDRFIEIELLIKDVSGLKIPNTSILKKDFFVIPKEYITKGGNSNQDGVIKETQTKDGEKKAEFISVTLFYETDDGYYVAHNELSKGDMILMPESNEKFTLSTTASLPGVYNINKGYAVFKQIEILAQNKEYTIIEEGTDYGLTLYDHIALDCKTIKEDELIK